MIFFQLLKLRGDGFACQFGFFRNFFGADRIPAQSDKINDLLLLSRKFVHPVLIEGGYAVENFFQIHKGAAVGIINENLKQNNNSANHAAGHSAQGFDTPRLILHNVFNAFSFVALTEFQE